MEIATSTTPTTRTTSNKARRSGQVIIALVAMFLVFDAAIHIAKIEVVVEAFERLGYSPSLAVGLGIVELVCLALYLIPSTSVIGAILLTGYLGGAVATHVRAGGSLFEISFPVYIGLFVWGALFLMDQRLRALIPLKR